MALLLSQDSIDAIAAGNRIRQMWSVLVPQSAAHALYNERLFHDDASEDSRCVTRAGSRTYVAVNASPMDDRKLQRARHAFTVRNDDGSWYQGASGGWWQNQATLYYAMPQECRIRHRVYVWHLPSAVMGEGWGSLGLDFTGQVNACDHTDARMASGALTGATATIQTDAMGAWDTLSHVYNKDDGADTWVDLQFDSTYLT